MREHWQPPPKLDLISITRNADRCRTHVMIYADSYTKHEWITLGEVSLRQHDRLGTWSLGAYLANATDFEHDSAHALKLSLVGVKFDTIHYGQTIFEAWIQADDPNDFHVPPPGYNPMKHPDAFKCKEPGCRKNDAAHVIVPEGFYVPPTDMDLWQRVRGRRVEVMTGVYVKAEK